MQQQVQHIAEKTAAAGTVVGGTAVSFQALTDGFNFLVAVLAVIAGVLAITWWRKKNKTQDLVAEKLQLEIDRLKDGGTPNP